MPKRVRARDKVAKHRKKTAHEELTGKRTYKPRVKGAKPQSKSQDYITERIDEEIRSAAAAAASMDSSIPPPSAPVPKKPISQKQRTKQLENGAQILLASRKRSVGAVSASFQS